MSRLSQSETVQHLEKILESSPEVNDVFRNVNECIAFQGRVEKLIDLIDQIDSAEPNLQQVYQSVFPGLKGSSPRVEFSKFRTLISRISEAESREFLSLVLSVICDEDRHRYVSASSDNTVKVWDAESFESLATIMHLPAQQWASFKPGVARPVAMSTDAAEHLKWVGREVNSQRLVAIPYEALR
ncbi:MAG: hypothetical protein P1V20_05460 [Verrucomicrobiales bacterium]|nr:hypothetical protein [Verrucomicrobiales bacterium]